VAFKKPNVLNRSILMPDRLFFTTKFYTFRETKTAGVQLRLPKAVANDLEQQRAAQNAQAENASAKPQGQLLEE